jgi:hypothetical protein
MAVGRRTADGAIMLLLAAMRGLVPQVSLPLERVQTKLKGRITPAVKVNGGIKPS